MRDAGLSSGWVSRSRGCAASYVWMACALGQPSPIRGLGVCQDSDSVQQKAWRNLLPAIIPVPDPETGRSRGRVRQGIAEQSLHAHARSESSSLLDLGGPKREQPQPHAARGTVMLRHFLRVLAWLVPGGGHSSHCIPGRNGCTLRSIWNIWSIRSVCQRSPCQPTKQVTASTKVLLRRAPGCLGCNSPFCEGKSGMLGLQETALGFC